MYIINGTCMLQSVWILMVDCSHESNPTLLHVSVVMSKPSDASEAILRYTGYTWSHPSAIIHSFPGHTSFPSLAVRKRAWGTSIFSRVSMTYSENGKTSQSEQAVFHVLFNQLHGQRLTCTHCPPTSY